MFQLLLNRLSDLISGWAYPALFTASILKVLGGVSTLLVALFSFLVVILIVRIVVKWL